MKPEVEKSSARLPVLRAKPAAAVPAVFQIGALVALRNCPDALPGRVKGIARGKIQVPWPDLRITTKHQPAALVMVAAEHTTVNENNQEAVMGGRHRASSRGGNYAREQTAQARERAEREKQTAPKAQVQPPTEAARENPSVGNYSGRFRILCMPCPT